MPDTPDILETTDEAQKTEEERQRAFGKFVRKLRDNQGLNQRKLAELVGYGKYAQISAMENGGKPPPYNKYQKLYKVLVQSHEEGNELDRLYLGRPQADQKHERVEPRLSLESEFVQDLLAVPHPIERNSRAYARLFGAMVATIKMLELVMHYGHLTPRDWEFPELFRKLHASIASRGLVNFAHSEDLAAWSQGFLRNVAHRGIAVVVERSIYDWYRKEGRDPEAEQLRNVSFLERLKRLAAEQSLSQNATAMLQNLSIHLSGYWDKKPRVADVLAVFTNPDKFPKRLGRRELFNKVPYSDAECCALMYWFDYAAWFEEENYNLSYDQYFVLTAKAIMWAAELRRTLLNL